LKTEEEMFSDLVAGIAEIIQQSLSQCFSRAIKTAVIWDRD